MKKNSILTVAFLAVFLTLGMACQVLKSKEITNDNKPAANTVSTNSETAKNTDSETVKNTEEKPKTEKKKGIVSIENKPDFIVQAEDLVKAYKQNGNSVTPPNKYKGKIIQVSGRVSYLYPEKEDSLAPRVQLTGGEPVIDDVSCEFDEENKAEIKTLKVDQMVTLKGLVPEYWLMHPTLAHCIIVEAK